ncbi:GIY-YIG nuclease family protein [Thalassotalea sp. ND16A]|uniref:GIY-YIG nuclease family protein n=1 Tax=Thalassotalea sp. ND16A TaxID=1535422 RepID=UPI00051A8357|nr:GIY-YIG nuclease family protein [Thalassotalea sp. ND16A]KGJ89226.1 hypothetical protein ND16A_2119 [Thalassotalea sp. ND16A]
MAKPWFVYILHCSDDSLYTGITTNIERRLLEHNQGGVKSAKYTRNRLPVKMVHHEQCQCRSSATKREMAIKKLTKKKKLQLIAAS